MLGGSNPIKTDGIYDRFNRARPLYNHFITFMNDSFVLCIYLIIGILKLSSLCKLLRSRPNSLPFASLIIYVLT